MSGFLRQPATAIWLLLVGATILSWALGFELADRRLGSVCAILIAVVKIRLVLMHFMELGHAPWLWRGLFEVWLAVVTVALLGLYLL